jgi:hypothetical protein
MLFTPECTPVATALPDSFRIVQGIAMLFDLCAFAQAFNVVTERA